MSETGTSRERISRLRDENLVTEAADAAGLDERGRESLEGLAAGLQSLPAAEASALLLRELDGLTYEEIAQLAGITSAGARQAVYRARIGLQGNPMPLTAHCDEVRVAMSKAETSVRDRRSITAHLERCEVCSDFADQLEERPRQLAILFDGPSANGNGLVGAAAGAGAGAAGITEAIVAPDDEQVGAAAGPSGAGRPERERPAARGRGDRAGRRSFVPLLLGLLLVGGGVALAVVLSSGGGKSHPSSAASTPAANKPAVPPAAQKPAKPAPLPNQNAHKAAKKHNAKPPAAAKKKQGGKKKKGGAALAAGTGAAAAKGGTASGKTGSGTGTGGKASSTGAGTTGGTAGGSEESRGVTTLAGGQSSAQAGYSTHGGSVEREVSGGGLPSTGLQIAIVVAAALLLVGLGLVLRGLSQPRA